jgi:hypothetical protein
MKELLRFHTHPIARAIRPENRAGPAKMRAVTSAQPFSARRDAGRHSAATGICGAFSARDPCNRRLDDHIRARPSPVMGTASIERP